MKKSITRREFLKESAASAITGALYFSTPIYSYTEDTLKSKVVLIRHKDATNKNNRPNPEVLQQMLDEAVMKLLDETNITRAWKKIIKSDDIVGIKTNVWRHLPTPECLENSIHQRVIGCGIDQKNISINDRGVLYDPIFNKATALINIRPMRTHDWSGVGSLLKNYIMFVDRPAAYHGDSCADLASIWKLPHVIGKTRLNILVMLTPMFHSKGPHNYNPQYTWPYNGLLVGFDPVATDAIGVKIIQAKRKAFFREERPINPPPKHIVLADTRHHLGTADPAKIELIELGLKDGILI